MCGIAGIIDLDRNMVSPSLLQSMADALAHRGPDGGGVWTTEGVGFSHRRLSIIDVSSAGSQPFFSSDNRYALTFNGEIYNYKELKETYFPDTVFVSESDTEVLLAMLIKYHANALPLLKGMFAFAFYDTHTHELLLATDPFGKKPLYYAWVGRKLLFGSEIKALLASGYVSPDPRMTSIPEYLQYEYVPMVNTAYNGIYVLPGGCSMRVSDTGVSIATWWRPHTLPKQHFSFRAAAHKFDELLGQAVERRMVADVPVGIFLSGGLDSSAIAWYMRSIRAQEEIHSCSVSFQEHSFNEAHYAHKIASSLGTVHHAIEFTYETFLSALERLIPLMDTPFADASLLPTYAISVEARNYMAVVLGGDGADELLGGYGTFDAYRLHKMVSWLPHSVWGGGGALLQRFFPVSHRYFSLDFKMKSFIRGAQFPDPRNLVVWLGAFTPEEIRKLLVREIALPTFSTPFYEEVRDSFDRASLMHIDGYLANDILVKFDRATMAASLEARTPFLDVDLAEFVLRLPSSYKNHKRILRHVMRGRISDDIINRKKQGFGIPLGTWFTMKDSIARRILTKERIEAVGLFNYPIIDELMTAHETLQADHRKKLWTLIMFQLWYEYWIQGTKQSIYA